QGASMRFAMLVIVLGFPLIDLYATVRIARLTGVPVYAWLGLAALAGLYLLRNERTAFRANTVAAMHGEQPLLRGLFDSGRKVLAGMLLLLPGILSDVMALALLALRFNLGREYAPRTAAAGDFHGGKALDGEFRRLD
ncbi:MAG: FxsA family protein, partial [Casimicrobiaceae bacterium]